MLPIVKLAIAGSPCPVEIIANRHMIITGYNPVLEGPPRDGRIHQAVARRAVLT